MTNKFIDTYNDYILSKKNFFVNEKGFNANKFNLIVKKKNTREFDFKLFDIVENHILDEGSAFSDLLFFEDLQQNSENSKWVAFAEYYGRDWYYTLDLESKKVFLIDVNTNFLQFSCATSEDNFLNAMQEVLKLESIRFNSPELINEDILNDFYTNCIKLSGLSGDNIFYKIILGV
ncbi:hypothetical protein [uncultured Aquimarina sp.]|uniref:hypothetical protein n=1 Tax=uncultured Aquimarina sp. TaxID=575652 RepID=UPI00261AF057|nr:hypothetical protein [uncultured Aquimarina sp.]